MPYFLTSVKAPLRSRKSNPFGGITIDIYTNYLKHSHADGVGTVDMY